MKILIQLDEHERNILGATEQILGFELSGVTFMLDSTTKVIRGVHNFAIGLMPPVRRIKIEGTIVSEIYQETWVGKAKPEQKLLEP